MTMPGPVLVAVALFFLFVLLAAALFLVTRPW
jgi:hypothetical protein